MSEEYRSIRVTPALRERIEGCAEEIQRRALQGQTVGSRAAAPRPTIGSVVEAAIALLEADLGITPAPEGDEENDSSGDEPQGDET